jgi:signal transduction histidine kinase/ligand-binding sensor domain-containing protein
MQRVFIYILLLFAVSAVGQNQSENFISFNTSNGKLMHNSVEAFARDQLGYAWVGTNFGLYRLDGYQTVEFKNDPSNPKSLSSNFIKALCTDSDGDLWVGTIGGGLNRFIRETNQFIHFVPNDSINSISGINISGIVEDKKGNIWIGTIGNGINKYNKKTGKFTHFKLENYEKDNWISSNVNALFCDNEGNIWVGENQSEIFKIDGLSHKITYYGILEKSKSESAKVGAITGISQMKNGNILFTTWKGNLYQLNPLSDKYISVFKTSEYFENSILTDIVIDSKNQIWISTWNNGLFKINTETTEKKRYKKNIKKLNTYNSTAINSLYIDNNQNLWTCFQNNGIGILPLKEKMIRTLPFKNEIFDYINAYSIVQDKQNNIWVGTRGQGLWMYNLKNNEQTNYLAENFNGLNTNSILSVKQSSDEKLLIGTDGTFLSIFNPLTNSFQQVEGNADDWSNAVFSIADNSDYIFAGTWGGGIKKIDKKDLSYCSINFDTKDQFRNSIFDLELVGNTLWVANIGIGLIKYNIVNDTYITYKNSIETPNFPSERITDIYIENDNSILLSTEGAGLYQFIPSSSTINNVFNEYGIESKTVQATVVDGNNNLWITTNSNILHVDTNTKNIYTFNKHNGLASNQFNKSALYFDKTKNRIYTGSAEGVNFLDANKIVIDSIVNKVIITQLSIMGENISSPNLKNIYKTIDVADTIHLYHKEKIITINFSSMEFTPSMKSRYYYQLEGFNKDWNETSYSKNFVQYTNLYPGEYTLHVKTCNSDGISNSDVTSIKILVHPAFWQTLLFKIAIVVLVILLYSHEKYQSLIKSQKELELKIAERTYEITDQKEQIEKQNHELETANQTKDKFFSIISHDLRNPLASINQMAQVLSMQFKTASEERRLKYLEILIKSSGNTLELLDDLLIWARTQTNRIKIKKNSYPIDELFYEVLSHCYPLAEKKNIELKIPLHTNKKAFVDKNTIATVLRNLITNAIKFSPTNSTIEVKVREKNESLIICISDQGIGISPQEIKKLFKIENIYSKEGTSGETGTGLGLVLCQEFLALNNGSIWVESEVNKGSTFCFKIEKG